MDLYYLILAHKNPNQLFRLVLRLNEDWVKFYIHIDKNVEITLFKELFKDYPNVFFLNNHERHEGVWGSIGIVKATINGLTKILNNNSNGYCILITGQDYPLMPNSAIRNFLVKKSGENFISIVQTPSSWTKNYKERIEKYKISKSTKRGHFLLLSSIFEKSFYNISSLGMLNYLRKTGNYKAMTQIFKKRKFPSYIEPYGGGVYFALPMDTIKKILNFHKEHPDFLEFNSYTLCADEVFFHSIIMKIAKEGNFKIAPSLTYVNWDKPSGPLPVTFTSIDFEELKQASGNYLWARKFDEVMDSAILDRIDLELLHKF